MTILDKIFYIFIGSATFIVITLLLISLNDYAIPKWIIRKVRRKK